VDEGSKNGPLTDEPRVFGMTLGEISAAADALSQPMDRNRQTETGTYQGLIANVRAGRTALSGRAAKLGVWDISLDGAAASEGLEGYNRTLDLIEKNKATLDLNAGEA
jgi:hypothetical protein